MKDVPSKMEFDFEVIQREIGLKNHDIRSVRLEGATYEVSIILERDTLIRGILYKGGTEVIFHQGSTIVKSGVPARDTMLPCGYNIFVFKAGELLSFFSNGNVSSGANILEGALALPLVSIKLGMIHFYEDGHLAFAPLVESFQIGNYRTKLGPVMFYGPDDRDKVSVKSCCFEAPTRWGNFETSHVSKGVPASISFSRGSDLEVPGTLIAFSPLFDIMIDGIICAKESPVYLYENQSLKFCELATDMEVQGIDLKAKYTYLTFFTSKRLKSIASSYRVTVSGTTYEPWARIMLPDAS